jgi:hypothetical protein
MKDGEMGGGNLPDDPITELDRRFEFIHFHHFADPPLERSGMAHYNTSFDNHGLSSSNWVNNKSFLKAWCGTATPHLSSIVRPGIFASGHGCGRGFTERWLEMTGKQIGIEMTDRMISNGASVR